MKKTITTGNRFHYLKNMNITPVKWQKISFSTPIFLENPAKVFTIPSYSGSRTEIKTFRQCSQ